MKGQIRYLKVTMIAGLAAILGLSGCASTLQSIDSTAALAETPANTLVMGKFQLIRNGQIVELGDGIFANGARFNIYDVNSDSEIVGKVGENGTFAWSLEPGEYHISSIDFRFQGQTVKPVTDFSFAVSANHTVSYIGTITLETTVDTGYLGMAATFDRITVTDDCVADCAVMLTQLGISQDASTKSLMRWGTSVASTN